MKKSLYFSVISHFRSSSHRIVDARFFDSHTLTVLLVEDNPSDEPSTSTSSGRPLEHPVVAQTSLNALLTEEGKMRILYPTQGGNMSVTEMDNM